MRVVISGGGIGGLTTALCCLQRGWQVTLLEQADAIKDIGAGIQLSPNAMRVFDALGINDAIANSAFKPQGLDMRDGRSNQLIARLKLSTGESPWGNHYYHIHRAALIRQLHDAVQQADNADLQLSHRVETFEQDQHCVQITATNTSSQSTRQIEADVFIAADGIHSTIRKQLLGDYQAQFTGNVAWRFTVPTSALKQPPPPTASVWFGKGKHAVTYRLGNGELCNFVGVVETDSWTEESWSQRGDKQAVLNDFEGWHPTVVEMISAADDIYLWALNDRPVLAQWYKGRTVLLGDACHAMLPFMAQGAAMAIEDAWCLAEALASRPNIANALSHYQKQRIPRCQRVQATANHNQAVFHEHGGPVSLLRKSKFWIGSRLSQTLAAKQLQWLYGYDVTH